MRSLWSLMLLPSAVRPLRLLGRGCGGALGADASEQLLGGFVGRVLVDELALEGPLEDRLAQTLHAC